METSCIETIKPARLAELWKNDTALRVIDVRTPGEYASVHAQGAQLEPLHDLDAVRFAAGHPSPDTPVYVLCKSGVRATQAAEKLLSAGLAQPIVVEGGTDAWVAAGLPVERRGRKVIPLDRQMRATAGIFIFLGALLALTVHPLFAWIPLLMGVGLFASGITGICPMTGVIARMPWNKGSGQTCCSTK